MLLLLLPEVKCLTASEWSREEEEVAANQSWLTEWPSELESRVHQGLEYQ